MFFCWIAVLTSFLPHKKFTWADFGGINTDIPPVATPLTYVLREVSSGAKCSASGHAVSAWQLAVQWVWTSTGPYGRSMHWQIQLVSSCINHRLVELFSLGHAWCVVHVTLLMRSVFYRTSAALCRCSHCMLHARGVATGVDIGIYTPKISPSKLFMG